MEVILSWRASFACDSAAVGGKVSAAIPYTLLNHGYCMAEILSDHQAGFLWLSCRGRL